jgi:hypothetical protein
MVLVAGEAFSAFVIAIVWTDVSPFPSPALADDENTSSTKYYFRGIALFRGMAGLHKIDSRAYN